MNIFLVGYMGSGKTTVGKPLAKKLGMEFFDMDNYFVDKHKRTINEVFAVDGEDEFRRMEKDIVQELCSRKGCVVATGGGAPCFFDNMDMMNEAGLTVYLQVSPEGLMQRLRYGLDKRPLLKGKSEEELLEFITEALGKREEFYSKAQLIVGCDGYTDMQIIDRLADIIKNNNF
ncbi:MAG: shikimate kinase [Rikenellaceae bacterium]|nr:shikimate kinase [Rikenellaceae bacterium]